MTQIVLLIFAISGGIEQISDRRFSSYEECMEFVNTLAGLNAFNSDFAFRFIASDGGLFEGQCIEQKEYLLSKGKLSL